jgi:hypothetical protein
VIARLCSIGVDRVVHAASLARSKRSRRNSRAESLGPAERIEALSRLVELYASTRYFDDPGSFFPPPEPVSPRRYPVRPLADGQVIDLGWSSRFEPFVAEIAPRYLTAAANRWGAARWYRHAGKASRPCIVLIHGYLAGTFVIEERLWAAEWFYRHGFDVLLPALPFHGPRRGRGRPPFPSSDPRITIEGFRQTVLDLRAAISIARDDGCDSVGVLGMSLGGYSAALLATVNDDLAFCVPYLPLASIADFARENGRLNGDEAEQREQYRLLESVYRVVSPMGRPVRVAREGRMVLAAEWDRITPVAHAHRIAEHFDVAVQIVDGGHILQLGRRAVFARVREQLVKLHLWS